MDPPDEFTRDTILVSIRTIFEDASVHLPVWEYIGAPRRDNALYVRFHPKLGEHTSVLDTCGLRSDTARLFGAAYDVSFLGFGNPDQFNERRGLG